MITKIDAAERQLDTAIKLFFENIDRLSSYTLAAASQEITNDLCDKKKSELFRSELERLGEPHKVRLSFRDELEIRIKTEHHKEAFRLIKKNINFLKHADKDPNETIEEISIKELSLVIFFSIRNFNLLTKRRTRAMDVFLAWFSANNSDLTKMDIDNEFSRQIRDLREKYIDFESKTAFNLVYERLKKSAPYLFPENPL
jgi:hypothetical protein